MKEKVRNLYDDSIIINGLDISLMNRSYLEKLHASGVTAANVTVTSTHNCRETIDLIGRWLWRFAEFNDILLQVEKYEDIYEAKKRGKVGIILGFQNASPLDDNLDLLRIYKRLGVKIIQLTYMMQNLLGNGCLERRDEGLSSFGIDVVKEMNGLGILIDLSHVGPRTTMEAIEASAKPVVFSHANCREVYEHPRNKSTEEFKILAENGGVAAPNAFPSFVSESNPTIEDFLAHLDCLVDLMGIDHVGIGLDFITGQPQEFFMTPSGELGLGGKFPPGITPPTWPWIFPKGIQGVSDLPNIVEGMLKRGYTEKDIKKVMGENFLKLFKEVWS